MSTDVPLVTSTFVDPLASKPISGEQTGLAVVGAAVVGSASPVQRTVSVNAMLLGKKKNFPVPCEKESRKIPATRTTDFNISITTSLRSIGVVRRKCLLSYIVVSHPFITRAGHCMHGC